MRRHFRTLIGPLGAGGGATLLAVASILSYLMGWLRDALFVRTFGNTATTDSYFKSFLLPDTLLTIFITGALLGIVIPLYINARKISEEEGRKVFGTFFFLLNGAYGIAALLCLVFLKPLLLTLFPDTIPQQLPVLQHITAILLFSNFFFALSNFLGHFLLAHRRFFAYALAPLLYNLGIILGIVFLHEELGIYAAAFGGLLGAFLHFLNRLIDFLMSRERFRSSWDFRNPFFRELVRGMWPKVVALLSLQIGFYFFARMGDALLQTGSYSAFQYARNLQSFSVSLFGISLATAVFPFLSEFAAEKKIDHFVFRFEKSLRQILFLALPSAVGVILLAPEIVRFIYGAQPKNFLTVAVLIPLAMAIPFESVQHLIVRTFHGLKSTVLPMISSILFLAILIGVSGVLVSKWHFGVGAFGIGYFLAFVFQVCFLMAFLPRFGIAFPWREFLSKFSRTILLTVLMAVVVVVSQEVLQDSSFYLRLLVSAALGVLTFFGGAYLWKLPEMSEIPFRKWVGKP